MKELKLYCGIDISNETIDICYQTDNENFVSDKLSNTAEGFKKLLKLLGKSYHFVMETTGVYHLPLCFFLHAKKVAYSVVPALQIKRFIQMNLERNKSDKKDAINICKYGISQKPQQYEMPDQMYFECKALNNAIEGITNEITVFKNKLHAINKLNLKDKLVAKVYQNLIMELQTQLKKLEEQLNKKLVEWQPELVKLVSSIPGIGKRATSILIVSTQGFKYTDNYKQLISFAGLSPKEFSSGTSIKSKVKICKMGGGRLRHVLYMGALNAKENNPACKELFDRLVAKGKNKKLAVIAVCNKMLKQVFGVVKNQELFNKNYLQKSA